MVQVDACPYCTGVPQDTRIGPWIFVVMISDLQLLSGKSFHVWKFADDTTVSKIIPPSCPSSLQRDFNFTTQRSTIHLVYFGCFWPRTSGRHERLEYTNKGIT